MVRALSARKRWDREDLLAVNHAPDGLNRGLLAWQRHQLLPLTAAASQRLRALRCVTWMSMAARSELEGKQWQRAS